MSSKVKSWLLLGAIFVLGIVTGSALTIALAPRLAAHFMPPPGAQEMKHHWMARLTQRLSLTPDQQAKIQPILTDTENKIVALHRDEVGRGSEILKRANDQIAAILTPAQQVELQKMESEREKMFSGRLHPWGASHGASGGASDGAGGMHHHGGWNGDAAPPAPASDTQTNAPPPDAPVRS